MAVHAKRDGAPPTESRTGVSCSMLRRARLVVSSRRATAGEHEAATATTATQKNVFNIFKARGAPPFLNAAGTPPPPPLLGAFTPRKQLKAAAHYEDLALERRLSRSASLRSWTRRRARGEDFARGHCASSR